MVKKTVAILLQNSLHIFSVYVGRLQESLPDIGFHAKKYVNSRWCYDTPGVVNPQQVNYIVTSDKLYPLTNATGKCKKGL